jgi:hypothetical protein
LEDDADVDLRLQNRLAVPENLTGRRPRQPRQHAQEGRFTRTRRAQQGNNLSLHNRQVSGRDHLDAIFAGLSVVLLNLLGADDRFSHGKCPTKGFVVKLSYMVNLTLQSG